MRELFEELMEHNILALLEVKRPDEVGRTNNTKGRLLLKQFPLSQGGGEGGL